MNDNKQIVLQVLKGAFIDRDPGIVAKYFMPHYKQHNPSIPDGADAIQSLIPKLGSNFSYEPGMAVAEGDLVMVHGRYVGWGPKPMVAVDIFRSSTARSPSIGTSCRKKCSLKLPPAAIPYFRDSGWRVGRAQVR
jgi:predicted SnoaL-like aldol condensation-catalyzing enzyme